MRADAAENKEKILTAATELLAEQGLSTTKRAIADAAGVGVGTLYRHFPTDVDLFNGIIKQGAERLSRLIHTYDGQWDKKETAEVAWENCLRNIAELRLGALLGRVVPELPEEIVQSVEVDQKLSYISDKYGNLIAKGRRWGLVRDDIEPLEFHLALSSVSRPWPERALQMVPRIEDLLIDIVIRGLRP